MTFAVPCVNCGCDEEEHDLNLVNEDVDWVDYPREGCAMSILRCMETKHTQEYAARIRDLRWENMTDRGWGFVSPDPEAQAAEYAFRAKPYMPTTVMIVYGRFGSYVVQGE